MLPNVVIFFKLSCEGPIDFHDKTLDMLLKNLKYFLNIIDYFVMFLNKNVSCPLKTLYRFIKSFADPFVQFASTFFDS